VHRGRVRLESEARSVHRGWVHQRYGGVLPTWPEMCVSQALDRQNAVSIQEEARTRRRDERIERSKTACNACCHLFGDATERVWGAWWGGEMCCRQTDGFYSTCTECTVPCGPGVWMLCLLLTRGNVRGQPNQNKTKKEKHSRIKRFPEIVADKRVNDGVF